MVTEIPITDEMRPILAKLFHRAQPEMFTVQERALLVIFCRRFIEPQGPLLNLARGIHAGVFLALVPDDE